MLKLLSKAAVVAAGAALPFAAALPASAVTFDEYGQVVDDATATVQPVEAYIQPGQIGVGQPNQANADPNYARSMSPDQAEAQQNQLPEGQQGATQENAQEQTTQQQNAEQPTTLPLPLEGQLKAPQLLDLPLEQLPLLQDLGSLFPTLKSGPSGSSIAGLPVLG